MKLTNLHHPRHSKSLLQTRNSNCEGGGLNDFGAGSILKQLYNTIVVSHGDHAFWLFRERRKMDK